MEDEAGEGAEEGECPADDTGLEANEDGKPGNKLKEASGIGEKRCGRKAGTADHPGRTGRIGELAEAGHDEHKRKQDAGDKKDDVGGIRHGRDLRLNCSGGPRAPAPFEPRLAGVVAFFGHDEKINK
ncbi:hypothetical protein AJ87_10195 [Rhizobium yanglingense]|nr:hypothetical protein AJ87_10195 [Rhizobium yanglingense]